MFFISREGRYERLKGRAVGAHEELGEFALSINPFDIQELADSIHAAPTMPPAKRRRRHEGLKSIVIARDPDD